MYLSLLIASICLAVPVVVTSTNITTSENITTATNSTTATNITTSTNISMEAPGMLDKLITMMNDAFNELATIVNDFMRERLYPDNQRIILFFQDEPEGVPGIYDIPLFLRTETAYVQDLLASYRNVLNRFERALGYVIDDENVCLCNSFASRFTMVKERVGDIVIEIERIINGTGFTRGANLFPYDTTLVPFPPTPNAAVRSNRDVGTLLSLKEYLALGYRSFERTFLQICYRPV